MANSKPVQSDEVVVPGVFTPTIKNGEALLKELKKIDDGFKAILKTSNQILKQSQNPQTSKQIKDVSEALDKSKKARAGIVEVDKQIIKQREKLAGLRTKEAKEIAKVKEEIRKENQELKNNVKRRGEATGSLNRQRATLTVARKRWDALSKAERENARIGGRLSKVITRLDTNVRRLEKSTGRAQRDVGNYGSAWKRASGALSTAGIRMIGIGTAIFAFTRAVGDAFTRIREFDKELRNMAGITGISRAGLEDVEKEIIKVAGSSIKTSNEVAKLATTLFTLGKTRSEVIKLLTPVNNLSIALGATSDEAGELLVQTLNAFGKSAASAQEFADIIANMRKSTALDFQRIKDALGFLAPVAKAAGISFEETGAILGVLVDNGIKAARAGRLVSTSFLKLAADGTNLTAALNRIKKAQDENRSSQELLSLSASIFGKESAAIGLILAENTEKTAELTRAFEDSSGSLDTLVNEQLKSLDAQIKILDSSYEEFILSIENGDGVISSAIKNAIKLFTGLLNVLTDINNEGGIITDATEKSIERLSKALKAPSRFVEAERKKGTDDLVIKNKLTFDLNTKQAELNDLLEDADDIAATFEFSAIDLLNPVIAAAKGIDALNDVRVKSNLLNSERVILLKADIKATEIALGLLEKETEVVEENSEVTEKAAKRNTRLRDLTTKNIKDQQDRERKLVEDRFEDEKVKKGTTDAIIVQLEKKKVADLAAINKKFADIRIKEIGKIQKENEKAIDKEIADAKKKAKELADIEAKKRKDAIDQALIVTNAINSELDRRNQRRSDDREREIEKNRDLLGRQEDLARQGADNELAFRREQQDKLALQKKEALEKEAREVEALQLAEAYLNALNAILSKPDADAGTAPAEALGTVLVAKKIAKTLVGRFDGIEDTGDGGDVDSRGGFLEVLHPHERVMSAADNAKTGGMSNADLANLAAQYNEGIPRFMFNEAGANMNKVTQKGASFDPNTPLYHEMISLMKEGNALPRQQVNVNELNQLVETVYKKGVKHRTTYQGTRKLRL